MANFYARSIQTGKKTGFQTQEQLIGFLSNRINELNDYEVSLNGGVAWHRALDVFEAPTEPVNNAYKEDEGDGFFNWILYAIGIWIILTFVNKFHRIEWVNSVNRNIEIVYRDVKSRVVELFDQAEDKANELEQGDLTN